jgi:conjugal transfer pilin signal peptidase TrbI
MYLDVNYISRILLLLIERIKGIFALLFGVLFFINFKSHYTFVIPQQAVRCLDESYFIREINGEWHRGSIVTFNLHKDLPPWFSKGEGFMKIAAAIEGDTVEITPFQVKITTALGDVKTYRTNVHYILKQINQDEGEVLREFIIPTGEFFALGTKVESYDSKYYGTVPVAAITGVSYAIM